METDDQLRQSIIDLLGISAIDQDVIAQTIVDSGMFSGSPDSIRERVSKLLQFDSTFGSVLDGVIFVPALMEGTTWSVFIDPVHAADGFVRAQPYLDPFVWWLVVRDVDLIDHTGAVLGRLQNAGIVLDDIDIDVIYGPDGWLDELSGAWATVTVSNGAMCWTRVSHAPDPDRAQVAALRIGFERAISEPTMSSALPRPADLRFTSGNGPVYEAMMTDRAAFLAAPVAPLPEFYTAAGLTLRNQIIAADGFDWEALTTWQVRNRLLATRGFDADQADRFELAVGACLAFIDEGPTALGAGEDERNAAALLISAILDDGTLASALWDDLDNRRVLPTSVAEFADELLGRVTDVPLVGLSWIKARTMEEDGDIRGAADLLAQAITTDCRHLPALLDAAGFASDRGDAQTALALVRQTGIFDVVNSPGFNGELSDDLHDAADLVAEVEGFAKTRPKPLVGRNDPCPCGSGRKYKVCHQGREQHSLSDRSAWLYDKAKRYLRTRWAEVIDEVVDDLCRYSPRSRDNLSDSPFAVDIGLHEEGMFEEFLSERNALLPDDEAMLAAQWALVDRSVFEIQRTIGDRLDLYDIGRGEHITVVNTHPSEATRPGTLLIGRPLPVGNVYRAFGGFMAISRQAVNGMLDALHSGDATEIIEFIARSFAPPRIQNTDGHDLVFHTMTWRIATPESIVDRELQAAGLQREPDETTWRLVGDGTGGMESIVATLELEGDLLTGNVNSDERAERLRALVAEVLPAAVWIGDDHTSIDDAMNDPERRDRPESPPEIDPTDPEIQAALAKFMADYERKWLDEPIPALGGRTPRQAVTDPVGREQVLQLLDSFPRPDPSSGFAGMDPNRIRAALGL